MTIQENPLSSFMHLVQVTACAVRMAKHGYRTGEPQIHDRALGQTY